MNGDSYSDVIVGAFGYSVNTGRAYSVLRRRRYE
ncbi:MAG: FG-GAP repeat protein [Ignavibacteria bacterium]|nr:FG-GAP repeat protein [Ignavibacteria bacterium]